MNPAFTASQLRSFLPLFRNSAQKVRDSRDKLHCLYVRLIATFAMPTARTKVEGAAPQWDGRVRAEDQRVGVARPLHAGRYWRRYVVALRIFVVLH